MSAINQSRSLRPELKELTPATIPQPWSNVVHRAI
jgi:hypothetical protein